MSHGDRFLDSFSQAAFNAEILLPVYGSIQRYKPYCGISFFGEQSVSGRTDPVSCQPLLNHEYYWIVKFCLPADLSVMHPVFYSPGSGIFYDKVFLKTELWCKILI